MNERLYEILLKKPSFLYYKDGSQRRGCAIHDAFWHGYNGFSSRYVRGSITQTAWMAGRDVAKKAEGKQGGRKEIVKIPCLCLTLGQQGGIGYPPVIIKLDRWYAVTDSRMRAEPTKLTSVLSYQRMWRTPYDHRPDKFFHGQGWVLRKWSTAPQLTWDDVVERVLRKERRQT